MKEISQGFDRNGIFIKTRIYSSWIEKRSESKYQNSKLTINKYSNKRTVQRSLLNSERSAKHS